MSKKLKLSWKTLIASLLGAVGAFAAAFAIEQMAAPSYIEVYADRTNRTYDLGNDAVLTVAKKMSAEKGMSLTVEAYLNNVRVNLVQESDNFKYPFKIDSYGNKVFKAVAFIENEEATKDVRNSIARVDEQIQEIQDKIDEGADDVRLSQELSRLQVLRQEYERRLNTLRTFVEEKQVTLLVNDNRPRVAFDSPSQSATKGQATQVIIFAKLNVPAASSISVPFIVSGTAKGPGFPDSDHDLANGVLNFSQGEQAKQIPVTITNTGSGPWPKTLIVTLQPGSNYVLTSTSQHTVNIGDAIADLPTVTSVRMGIETAGLPAYVQMATAGISQATTMSGIKIDFGDGNIVTLTRDEYFQNDGAIRHLYRLAGNYTVKFTPYNALNQAGPTYEFPLVIYDNAKPRAVLSIAPAGPGALTFDANGSSVVGGNITNYEWLFGDGAPEERGQQSAITHTFNTAGTGTQGKTVNVRLRLVSNTMHRTQVTIPVKMEQDGSVRLVAPVPVMDQIIFIGDAPLSINFDASRSLPASAQIDKVLWDFNDVLANYNPFKFGGQAQYIYQYPGVYSPRVMIRDMQGNVTSQNITVIAIDPSKPNPNPDFVAERAGINSTINFSTGRFGYPGAIDTFHTLWNFGDGAKGNGRFVTKAYTYTPADPVKSYAVKLSGIDVFGKRFDVAKNLIVRGDVNSFPRVELNSIPYTRHLGNASFDNAGITHWNPGLNLTMDMKWYFCDGTSISVPTTNTFVHSYNDRGMCPSPVVVTDSENRSTVGYYTPSISDGAEPTAQATVSSFVGEAPLTVNFDAGISYSNGAPIRDFQWNFGDVYGPLNQAFVPNSTHTYNTAGQYNAIVWVSDDSGNVTPRSYRINVLNPGTIPSNAQNPVANLQAFNNPQEPGRIDVDGQSVFNDDGNEGRRTLEFDFGDEFVFAQQYGRYFYHVYKTGGIKTIKLTVTNSYGKKDSITKTIEVPPPSFRSRGPSADIFQTGPGGRDDFSQQEGCEQVGERYECVIPDRGENNP